MTTLEQDTKILKDYISKKVESLEKGDSAYIQGGYLRYSYEERLIDANCSKIVGKLVSLGYEYTTNHGFGCKDYSFSKPIEL